MKKTTKQRGAVSLFVVIFAALLITVVTVSFIRIMVQNQQQAIANDLSQSAYDSALAGVEDAKRAVLLYLTDCSGGNCDLSKIESPTCNEAVQTLSDVPDTGNEIPVQTTGTSGDEVSLNQAYTCVKVKMQTDDYVGVLVKDASKIIPLVGNGTFDKIKIEWFNSSDMQGETTSVDVPNASAETPLLDQNAWLGVGTTHNNRPAILRTQLIEFDKRVGFSLNDFDIDGDVASNNALFLYPSNLGIGVSSFLVNVRPTVPGAPSQVHCDDNLAPGGYACAATLILPKPVDGDHTAYLNLKSLYRKSNYRITLLKNDDTRVLFDKVQPTIDSTGRANNLFRRVQTRVELTNVNFPYPQAEILTPGNLCKDFMVTDNPDDYSTINTSLCTPPRT